MSEDKSYFQGRSADEYENGWTDVRAAKAERSMVREAMMIWLCRIGLFVLVASLPWGLASCATVPEEEVVAKVCYMRSMGRTDEGYAVVMQACQSPESFSASQQ